MSKSRHTEAQMIGALKQVAASAGEFVHLPYGELQPVGDLLNGQDFG